MKKKIMIAVAVVAVLVVVFLVYRSSQQTTTSSSAYNTVPFGRGDLTAIIGATGTVRANQSAVLTWQTNGTVAQVFARLDGQVGKDEVLAQLDPASLSQAVILAQADLVTAQRNLDQLKNSDVARSQALVNLAKTEKAYNDALEKRQSKRFQRANQNTIDTARANLILAQDALNDAEELYGQMLANNNEDITYAQALSALAAARQRVDKAKADLQYAQGLPEPQDVAEADANVALTLAQYKDAQREWERLKDGPDPDDLAAAQARVSALEATRNMDRIKAPFAGVITEDHSKVGDIVSPGTVSFRLDDFARLLIDVQVPEVDINRIRVNQPATLSFDAIQGKTYNGMVSEVARVGTAVQGVVNFTVTVELVDADEAVRPGMTAAVNVIVDQLSGVPIIPNRAVRLYDGNRVIFVLRDNQPAMVEIELGSTSDMYSELVSGDLQEGEWIILNPPAISQQGGGGPPNRGE